MKSSKYLLALLLLGGSVAVVAQNAPTANGQLPAPKNSASSVLFDSTTGRPTIETMPAQAAQQNANAQPGKKAPDRAAAYYHYSLAHMYEELVAMYGRTEFANKAIEEYRLAIENDPGSPYLNSGLAELYAKTGRIRDAVLEAQDIIKRDPTNIDARRLLGRIYLRSLGDLQAGTQSQNILKLAIEQYEQIVKLDPKSIEDHLLLGRLYRLNNDLSKAEQEFKTAVSLDHNSEEAVTTLAYLYNEEGDGARALAILNAIPEAERSAKLYSALGYTYEQQKDYKNAITAYRKSVDEDKDNLDALRGLAQNLMNDGQIDAALEQYKAISEADPQDAQTYLRMAEIYRRDGRFDQALASLKKAEGVVQDSQEIPYNIAVIYEAQGRYDEAAQIIQQLLTKTEKPTGSYTPSERNNRSVFLERLGTIYREQNKTQASIDTFRKMVDLGDENASRGYQQMIETYRDAKQWSDATNVAKEAAAKLPNDRALKMLLASQLADDGQAEAGLNTVKALITGKNPNDDREAYVVLAQMYSRLKRWKEAEDSIAQAEKLSKRQDEKDYATFIVGSMYERQKKYDLAEESFRKVLASNPRDAQVLNYLGYMLADRGTRLEEALGYIRKAIALDPQNGAYLDSLGWAYYKIGNYDLAEENLRKASDKLNADPTVHDHLADLYQKTGRLKLAATHWQRALEEWQRTVPAERDSEEVAKVQKKLDSAKVKLANMQK